MSTLEEIKTLEEAMRIAELQPDPQFFEDVLDDNALMDGQRMKQKVVAAHRPGQGQKFDKVEIKELEIVEHGSSAAVSICKCNYEGPQWSGSLRFMRTWIKKDNHWRIISAATLKD